MQSSGQQPVNTYNHQQPFKIFRIKIKNKKTKNVTTNETGRLERNQRKFTTNTSCNKLTQIYYKEKILSFYKYDKTKIRCG